MQPILPRVRKPVVRVGAARYLLFTLLSFATSVSLTRLFLELTGYPQLGKGSIHIAHVLWGGLLLFIAALLPLVWVNRWALIMDAVIAGAGVGLFIDEVGKFITQSNNYFYPAAAPIIYAFFLLTVLLYLEIRKPRKPDTRAILYSVFDDMEEVLDQDLSTHERERLLARLNRIETTSENPEFIRLVKELKDFVTSDTIYLVPHRPDFIERGQRIFQQLEKRWIDRRGMQVALAGGLFAAGLWIMQYPIVILFDLAHPLILKQILLDLYNSGLVHSPVGLFWFEARLGIQAGVGLLLLISSGFLLFAKDRIGISLGSVSLLIALTVVNLLMFYFDQFSTIITALYQFIVFSGLVYYRRRFLLIDL